MESSGCQDVAGEDANKIYVIDLSSKNLNAVPKYVQTCKNCKSINLSCNLIEQIEESDFSSSSHLKELKIYGNKIEHIHGFQKLVKLEQLQLQFNRISSLAMFLKQCKNLKLLRLDSNCLVSINSSDICALSNLTYLDVSSNSLTNIGSLNVLSSVEELHCTHNLLAKVQGLRSLKKLREVDLSFNLLTDISGLKELINLTTLNVNNNKLSNLKSLGVLKSLQDLKANHNQLADLKHVVEQFSKLEVLHIAANKIRQLSEIEHLSKLTMLRELNLDENMIMSESKVEVLDVLDKLDLDLLNNTILKKSHSNLAPKVMRPMSANQMMSTRLIEDQMNYSEICMNDFEDKLKSQFAVVHSMLEELPATRPTSSSERKDSCHQSSSGLLYSRPSSRCSSRARLEEAKAFAAENF